VLLLLFVSWLVVGGALEAGRERYVCELCYTTHFYMCLRKTGGERVRERHGHEQIQRARVFCKWFFVFVYSFLF
jgi:hypothetical protein